MLRISKLALAAALISGAGGLALSAPVAAKEKPKAEEPKLKFSKEVLAPAQIAKPAIDSKDYATAEPAVVQAEAAAKTDDDRYLAASLRLALEAGKIEMTRAANPNPDRSKLIAPYAALIANPKTPQENAASYALDLGIIYYNSKQYPQAVTYWEQAQKLGSTEPNLAANLVRAKIYGGDAAGGLLELSKIVDAQTQAKGRADEDLYRFAIGQTVKTKDAPGTLSWMRKYLVAYPTPKNWRDMVMIYGLQQGAFITPTKSQSLDLFRLLHATNALAGEYDYEEYGERARDSGLPYETRMIITEGRTKGKIPAASGRATDLLNTANASIKIEGSLAPLEAKAKSSSDGKLAAQTGDAQLGSANYAKAVELYRLALQKGGANTNDVNTRLGIALAMSGDKAGAKTAFAAVTGSPGADIAALWTAYLDAPPAAAAAAS